MAKNLKGTFHRKAKIPWSSDDVIHGGEIAFRRNSKFEFWPWMTELMIPAQSSHPPSRESPNQTNKEGLSVNNGAGVTKHRSQGHLLVSISRWLRHDSAARGQSEKRRRKLKFGFGDLPSSKPYIIHSIIKKPRTVVDDSRRSVDKFCVLQTIDTRDVVWSQKKGCLIVDWAITTRIQMVLRGAGGSGRTPAKQE